MMLDCWFLNHLHFIHFQTALMQIKPHVTGNQADNVFFYF